MPARKQLSRRPLRKRTEFKRRGGYIPWMNWGVMNFGRKAQQRAIKREQRFQMYRTQARGR